jgi:hypothetical protein
MCGATLTRSTSRKVDFLRVSFIWWNPSALRPLLFRRLQRIRVMPLLMWLPFIIGSGMCSVGAHKEPQQADD